MPNRLSVAWRRFRGDFEGLYRPPLRRRTTYGSVRHVLDVCESLGVVHPRDLTCGLVSRFSSRDLSGATIKGQLGYLRLVCSYAHFCGLLLRSPFDFRRDWSRRDVVPCEEAAVRRHYSAVEIGRVLELASAEAAVGAWSAGRLEALCWLFALTGLRRAEGLGLRCEDLDLVGRAVYVRCNRRRGLKTHAASAPVPLAEVLVPVLERWVRRAGCEWLFPGVRLVGPWTGGRCGSRAGDALRQLGERAGVSGVHFSGLRHSWATHAEGLWCLSEPQIQRVLRHTSVRTSRDWYRHPDLLNLRAAVGPIDFPRAFLGVCDGGA